MRSSFYRILSALALVAFVAAFSPKSVQDPPFSGTIFIDPDIITSADPTAFESVAYTGRGDRTMFDRRAGTWIQNNAYLFQATYNDGLSAEIQVNSEFGSESAAMVEASRYALEVGRLPTVLRSEMQTMWIHKGVQPFGGGNHNILIHTGQSDLYIRDSILEETLVHEASHTSLDPTHAASSGWLAAQLADPEFISTYARDNPNREDVAETFLTYLAVRHRADRISTGLKQTIEQAIPNRIAYFDGLQLDLYPMVQATGSTPPVELPEKINVDQNHPNPFSTMTTIPLDLRTSSHVQLVITNVLGQRVTTLLNDYLVAGKHDFLWDGRDAEGNSVPNGTYVYQVSSPEASYAMKMVRVN